MKTIYNCEEEYIKAVCERAAFDRRIIENAFPEMMFGLNPKDKNIVRNWNDFKQGEKYYIWSKRILPENRKIYELKHIIKELNGDVLNICIMKQYAGPKSKMFTLTESDCEHINIDFEYGLEVYPVNICWVKYKKTNDAEIEQEKINTKVSLNEYVTPKMSDYNKNYYARITEDYIRCNQLWSD